MLPKIKNIKKLPKNKKYIQPKLSKFKQSRNWCFTDFKMLDYDEIYKSYKDIIRYIGIGKEICPKTGRAHIQGWIQFVNKKTLGGVKRILRSKEIHLETCRGTEIENDRYCGKEADFTHIGDFKIQGQRTDLEAIKKDLDEGKPMLSIAQNYFSDFIRYFKGFQKYRELVQKDLGKAFRKVKVKLLTGPTGSGKTRYAMEYKPSETYKITGSQLGWFDGYEGESILVIDEYSNDVKITQLLNILDGYQLRLPVKGGFTYARWTQVFITTNLEELHLAAKPAHRDALHRRITSVESFW